MPKDFILEPITVDTLSYYDFKRYTSWVLNLDNAAIFLEAGTKRDRYFKVYDIKGNYLTKVTPGIVAEWTDYWYHLENFYG